MVLHNVGLLSETDQLNSTDSTESAVQAGTLKQLQHVCSLKIVQSNSPVIPHLPFLDIFTVGWSVGIMSVLVRDRVIIGS